MKNKIFVLLFIVFNLITSGQLLANEEESKYYEVSQIFHERANRLSCEFVSTELKKIQSKSDEEIRNEIEKHLEDLEAFKDSLQNDSLKGEVNFVQAKLKEMSNDGSAKKRFKKGLEKICSGVIQPIKFLSRGVALGNSAVLKTVAFPLTGFFSFWNGFFNRQKSELGASQDFFYRAFGPKNGMSGYLLGLVGSEALNFLLHPNPVTLGLNASIAIEMITNYRCFHLNKYDQEQVNFCEAYKDLSNFYHRGHQAAFRFGHKIQKYRDQRLIERRADFDPGKYCSFSKKRQIKIARRVLQRHEELRADKRIKEIHILLPIHKNKCTKFLFYTDTNENLESLKSEKKYIEGIQVEVMTSDKYPEAHYYTDVEMSEMSFDKALCYEAESAYYGQFLTNKWMSMKEGLKSSLAPALVASPSTSQVIVPDQLLREGTVSGLRNIILSIGNQKEDQKRAIDLKSEQQSIIKKIKKDYRYTIKSGSFEGCQKILAKRNVDIKEFEEDLKRINEISLEKMVQRQIESDLLEHTFKKQKKKLKLNWELINVNDLDSITSLLKSPQVGNVIIISHGKSTGHLVDSLEQELPREAFNQLSPTLMSLNFYSCHSKKLIDLYGLKDKMSRLPSFYKTRYVTNVTENEFMGETNLAPMAAFAYYLAQLDKHLKRSFKGADLLQNEFGKEFQPLEDEKMCHLEISDFKITKGSYAITLNDEFIVSLNSSQMRDRVEFPCRFISTEALNTLRIKNIMNGGGSVIENLKQFKLGIESLELTEKESSLRMNSMVIFKFKYQ
jgi:hypothetical protein